MRSTGGQVLFLAAGIAVSVGKVVAKEAARRICEDAVPALRTQVGRARKALDPNARFAEDLRAKYDALRQAGFGEDEARQLLVAHVEGILAKNRVHQGERVSASS